MSQFQNVGHDVHPPHRCICSSVCRLPASSSMCDVSSSLYVLQFLVH